MVVHLNVYSYYSTNIVLVNPFCKKRDGIAVSFLHAEQLDAFCKIVHYGHAAF